MEISMNKWKMEISMNKWKMEISMNKWKMEVLYMQAENLTAAATALHGFKVLPTVLCPRNVVRKSLKFLTVPGTTDGRWK
jgi:hypothetical protein